MASTVLRLTSPPSVPLECDVLTPDVLAPLTREEIAALPVYHGNQRQRLDAFFRVEGDGSDTIEVHGDCLRVKNIGRGMTRGRITVVGRAGFHLGAQMRGGTIEVRGDATDWVGAEMTGGTILIHGNAGNQIGAAYRGSPTGMRGGTIVVDGDAGGELGARMRGGLIAVRGAVGDFAGTGMRGGTLVLTGRPGSRLGAWMRRGTIVTFVPPTPLPTFIFNCSYVPVFLRLYFDVLTRLGVQIPEGAVDTPYEHYSGDHADDGKGEILVWTGACG
ncbi:MAG: formylmethanofuran dehydrogenase subunit C [Armatimonadota bacterium]|nr:formylmethanofuran dehydrogenase subunit C [Armatimonadota bacterium]